MEIWDTKDSVAALEASYKRGGGRARTIVWLIGLPLLVGLIVVAADVVSQSKLDWNLPNSIQNLTAGIMGKPSPSPSPRTALPPPLPSAADTPSTSAAASGAPGANDSAALFADFVNNSTASYHLETNATAKQGGQTLTIAMSIDEMGSDYAGNLVLNAGNGNQGFKFVVKDGVAYSKQGGAGWLATRDLSTLDLPSGGLGFSAVEPGKIQDLGREVHAGRNLEHLRVLTAPAAGFSSVGSYSCPSTDLPWDIWVRGDGQPVSAEFDYSCTIDGSMLTTTATYDFSQLGKHFDIVPPAKYTQR